LEFPDESIQQRGTPVLLPNFTWQGKCLEILGMDYPAPQQPTYERATGIYQRDEGIGKIAVKTNVTFGFSGGPVFSESDDWKLVGIIISAREDRDIYKLLRDVSVISSDLQQNWPSIRVAAFDNFPSQKVRSLTGLDFKNVTQNNALRYMQKLMKDDREKAKIVIEQLLMETFADEDSVQDPEGLEIATKGRDMLDRALQIMFNAGDSFWDSALFSKVTKKLIDIWKNVGTGIDQSYKLKVKQYLYDDARYHESYCDREPSGPKFTCYTNVERKYGAISKTLEGYYNEASRKRLADDSGELVINSFSVWSEAFIRGLLDWGEFLSKIADIPPPVSLADTLPELFLKTDLLQGDKKDLPNGFQYFVSSLDKYRYALTKLAELDNNDGLNSKLKKRLKGLRKELCTRNDNILERLRQDLSRSNAPSKNSLLAIVRGLKTVNDGDSPCVNPGGILAISK
jgi:hypothetical protein